MKKYLIVFVFIFYTTAVISQTFHIGAMAGYERVWTYDMEGNNARENGNSISFVVDFKPDKPIFNVNSGLTFQTLYSYGSTFNFLKLPLGLDFLIGKKNQLFFGFGIYGQSLLFKTGKVSDHEFYSFQFGAYADLGFRFRLNDKYSLFYKFQYDRDLTPFYKSSYGSKFGFLYYEDEFLSDLSINLGFIYTLNNK